MKESKKKNDAQDHKKNTLSAEKVLESKKMLEPYLEKIIRDQKKGQYSIYLDLDREANLHIHLHTTVLAPPFDKDFENFENILLGILWHLLSQKPFDEFDEKENYKAKIKRDFLPLLLDIQEKFSIHFFNFCFDENADIFTIIAWIVNPDPWPENLNTYIIRQSLAKLMQISELCERSAALQLNNL